MSLSKQRMARVQMNLPEKSIQRLDALVAKTEASSYAEVMRNALRLYEVAVAETDAGGGLFVRRPHGFEPVIATIGA